ncbi:MAG: serine/threonine protein kinase [Proteobacteria bacterium]|nr:serine/threonine protein kinase [Pseudomonadota bacterium]
MDRTQSMQTPDALRIEFRYIRLLGEGANGKTYLAQNLNTGQYVAIKAFKSKQIDAIKNLELFKREAMTLSSITVPGVPRFYKSLFSNDLSSDNYIIQEYIDAPSLQTYLDEKHSFSEQDTLILMAKIAQILTALHTRYTPPIIHRDIKPSNILCRCPQNQNWKDATLYLIDFGAVANACTSSDKSTIAGTIGYMAPEQNFGECLPQSDYYALGATALHLLTGVPPYEMDYDGFTPKIDAHLDKHAPNTSPYMRELIAILLNKDANKRPQTPEILAQMIHLTENRKSPTKAEAKVSGLNHIVLQAISRVIHRILSFAQTESANGFIQSYSGNEIYYTFDAHGLSWGGHAKMDEYLSDHPMCILFNVQTGTPCHVRYSAAAPQNNSLDLISPERP